MPVDRVGFIRRFWASPAETAMLCDPLPDSHRSPRKPRLRAHIKCKNFQNIKVGTYADCQMRVNGVKQGLRATFTLKDGQHVLKAPKLTW